MKREATLKNSFLGRRAVVIGAGLGGLSAARVLADYFDEVIILDRDELPDDAAPRPGVPQGKHPHRLLGGGLKALENLFPGFGHELMRAGAEPMEPGLVQEANLLFDLLRTLDGSQLSTLAPTFLTKAETLIAAPWAMSAIPDFIYPETTGERPADLEDRLNFQRALGRLAVRDPEVYELLTEIRNLLKPLSLLDDPSIVRRVKEEIAKGSQGKQSLAIART